MKSPESSASRTFSRRRVLERAASCFATAAALDLMVARPRLKAQAQLTPDAALKQLMDGNERYVSAKMTSFEHDLQILREHNAEKQEPFAAVLSCADSRVPVEVMFDQTIGHIFVTRVAGNVATSDIIASLEYGAAVLGTKVILVLGHSGCGAVKAALQGKEVPGQISSLFPYLQPAVDQGNHDLIATTKANAQIQARLLRESSTVLASMVKENKVKVLAGMYDIAAGKVTLL
jgi:carbonic anhydrase